VNFTQDNSIMILHHPPLDPDKNFQKRAAKKMFIVTHFSIPFYGHLLFYRHFSRERINTTPYIYSIIIGTAGILPDLTSIHISLAARHNALSHTIWAPLFLATAVGILLLFQKNLAKSFLFWLPFAVVIHLFLDALSGGIRLFYPTVMIVGAYYIHPAWWGVFDTCFISLLLYTYRFLQKKGDGSAS